MPEQTAMPLGATTDKPSSLWRASSSATMFEIGALCRAFLLYANTPEVNGLESFMELLDSRRDPSKRTRGLITGASVASEFPISIHRYSSSFTNLSIVATVSNHISVYVRTSNPDAKTIPMDAQSAIVEKRMRQG